ncbi:hypothetical protein DFS34DRAFT_590766 [Phlyctochytrium arcticum]|nr:hypothetical protein DFS34DRAFT_590766 [Phlyctochytrium arcticum]
MIQASGTKHINLRIQRPRKIIAAEITSSFSSKTVTKRKRDFSSRPSVQSHTLSVDDGEPLPLPSVIICDPSLLRSKWPQPWSAGPGLINPHTLCYLNSTLQVLVNACLDRIHGKVCQATGVCLLCLLERHIRRTFLGPESGKKAPRVVNPTFLSRNLPVISKSFRLGRQEDCHEFLRCLIEMVTRRLCWHACQIRCSRCSYTSRTYEQMLDLSLDVVASLNKAFALYSKAEKLEGDNKYRCDRCAMLVDAVKRVTVAVAPEVLTIQLKRFDVFGRGKNCAKVDFPESLDITPSMTLGTAASTFQSHGKYNLYGVICHHGQSPDRGHYTSFVKGPTGSWTFFNDDRAIPCKLEMVLAAKTDAYMLFYTRHHDPQVVGQPDSERVSSQSHNTAVTAAVIREDPSPSAEPIRDDVTNVFKDAGMDVPPPNIAPISESVLRSKSKKARTNVNAASMFSRAAAAKVANFVSRLIFGKQVQQQPCNSGERPPRPDRTDSMDALINSPNSPTTTQTMLMTRPLAPIRTDSQCFMMDQCINPNIPIHNLRSSTSHRSRPPAPLRTQIA